MDAVLPHEPVPVDPEQLLRRWRAGREQLLLSFGVTPEQLAQDEGGAAAQVAAEQQAELQRRVFLLSRQLGLKTIAPLDVVLEPSDLAELLLTSAHPCLSGTWTSAEDGQTFFLTRKGCGHPNTPARCDYWREAMDGLVMGLGDDARYARHRSQGHGDAECVDVWFEGASSPRRWGPVPDALLQALEQTTAQLAASGVQLILQGFSEGTLYYQLRSNLGPACGPGGVLLRGLVKRALDSFAPGLTLMETTPQGVLGNES